MRTGTRSRFLIGAGMAAIGAGGCQAIEVAGPERVAQIEEDAPGNVVAYSGDRVMVTDNMLLLDGNPRLHFGSMDVSLYFEHVVSYEYGSHYGRSSDTHRRRSWLGWLTHQVEERRDGQAFHRFVDYGDATIGGFPMRKHTDVPVGRGRAEDPVYTNFIRYTAPSSIELTTTDGRELTFGEPEYGAALLGGPVQLVLSGSAEVEPLRTSFALRKPATLVSMTSGTELEFELARPRLRGDQPLVLRFDRELDPDQAFLRLAATPRGETRPTQEMVRATFWIQPLGPASEIVIPREVMGRLLSGYDYELVITEILTAENQVVATDRAGGAKSLPLVQRNHIRVNVGL